MSFIRNAFARVLRSGDKVSLHFTADWWVAAHVRPLIDKLIADDKDGEALRNALIPWQRAERPPIALYRGDVSTCRIDGPWQTAGDHWFPLGGLILSPGVTAHLTPFEAQMLHTQMQETIETVILAFVREHDLSAFDDVPEEIDRKLADPAAKAIIVAWFAKRSGTDAIPNNGMQEVSDRCSSEAWEALCAASRKGPDHG